MHRFSLLFSLFIFSNIHICLAQPKLVVGIVVDQMRYDYLYRYEQKYGKDGFKRLLKDGYSCSNANYNYVPTYTAPGHASIYTGTTPAVNGIVGNEWYDRKLGKTIYVCEDSTVKSVGSKGKNGQMSPKNLLVSTITDQLKLNNSNNKVVSIALKDRGAILPAGHLANGAYWFDTNTGNWITSSYYAQNLPNWVNDFNKQKLADSYLSKEWHTLLPINTYTESLADDNEYEIAYKGESKPVFPHNLPAIKEKSGYKTMAATPFGNDFTLQFALQSIVNEKLGQDNNTDFLAISFSSTDYVGHQFGINSVEIEDTYLRLDKNIANLLQYLDKNIGKDKYLLFLTADHGAAYNPTYLKSLNIPAGNWDANEHIKNLKAYLNNQLGAGMYIEAYENQQIYFYKDLKNIAQVMQICTDYLSKIEGVESLLKPEDLKTDINLSIYNKGYYAPRCGDLIIKLQSGWFEGANPKGTTHGSEYSYDTHVPLLWYGNNIKKGYSNIPTAPEDIAPTLSDILHIEKPNGSTGKIIENLAK